MRRWFAGLAVFGMVTGCSLGSDGDDTGPIATMALVSFDACADALDYLKREAHDRVGPWGLDGGYGGHNRTLAVPDSADAAESGDEFRAPEQEHSTTNVQEIGVDEPDVVKTDGRSIVTVTGADLRVVDVSGGPPREVGRLSLSKHDYVDANLLLSGDKAIVLVREQPMVAYDEGSVAPDIGSYYGGEPKQTTTVLQVDLSEPSAPTVESTLTVDGSYLDARMIDETVRLVVSSRPDLAFPMTEQDRLGDEDALIAKNRDVIANSTIEDWLPSYRLNGDDATSGELVSCDRLSHPDEFAGFSTVSVLTFDLAAGLSDGAAVGVLTDGDTVYASTDRLYVATARWGDPVPDPMDAAEIMPTPGDQTTGIHAFDITGDGAARYVASGEVDGRIIGQYAMSEHEDILRVATTRRLGAEFEATESQLVTLDENGDELVQVGQVGGLGKGEEIYAVRYFGPTGYVVTFRQVDPLYVLDLSDPASPAVTGELKITGYSAYLHDVGEDRLVGVGQEATSDGVSVGAQVSLFDVRDPTAPAKLDGHVVRDAWSQAQSDPHAFLYWPQTGQLVVPIDGMTSSGALVLRVDDDSVTEQGLLTRDDDGAGSEYHSLTRTLVIGDTLYTLWQDGLQANSLDDLEPQSWLPFT